MIMKSVGRLVAFAKALQRAGNKAAQPEFSVAQRLQFQSLTRVEGYFSQPSHPLAEYRPWYPTFCKSRSIHSSDFARQTALEESSENHQENDIENYLPRTTKEQKPRLVVLGTGWAGCRLIKDINPKLYDIVCISRRNHMVFTPLLASTCVGTLEFRSVVETVRTIQPAIAQDKDSYFFLARCTKIDTDSRRVHCTAVGKEETADMTSSGQFSVPYDKLVIALGAESTTFGIPGVHEHAIFLREVRDAQSIRSKLLLNLAISDVPGVTEEEKRKILHCVVVGGGPTGVEFSGELSDFIRRDVIQRFSHVKDYIRVTLIEATEILSSFDDGLRQYATSHLEKTNVKLVKGLVKEVHPEKVVLSDGTDVPYGLLVWSTGVGPSDFVKDLSCEKSPNGRLGVDDFLRVPGFKDVYAIGDCSGYLASTGKGVLPALAQVAERQGKYLAETLNLVAQQGGGHAGATEDNEYGKPFVYKHMGSMASVGRYKALVDLRENKKSKGVSMAGFSSWIVWRSAYLTRVISWRNRIYVAINWATTFVFGRDISRF